MIYIQFAAWTHRPDADVASIFYCKFCIRYISIIRICTTSPAYKLDVYGNARIDGDLTVDGTINGADYCFANKWCITEGFKLDKTYKALVFLDEDKKEIFEITKHGAITSESSDLVEKIEELENRLNVLEQSWFNKLINWLKNL